MCMVREKVVEVVSSALMEKEIGLALYYDFVLPVNLRLSWEFLRHFSTF